MIFLLFHIVHGVLKARMRSLYAAQGLTAPDVEQWTGLKLGKEYVKTVYCHSDYLTSMQSISQEILGWVNHKLESRLPGEKSTISEMQMIPL